MLQFELPGGNKVFTPNNEKTILVAKCGVLNMQKSKALETIAQFNEYLKKQFNPPEYEDDTLVILTIPSDEWEIQFYNPKFHDMTEEDVTKLIEEYKETCENFSNS